MVTALIVAGFGLFLYLASAAVSSVVEIPADRNTAFSNAKSKFQSGESLSDAEAELLLEDELLENRNNRFRNF